MDKIRIITDTSSDLSAEDAERYDIELLPVIFQIDGKPCYEGIDFTNAEFYDMMPEHEKITAVQIPAAVYLDRYEKAHRHGYTDVIAVTAGSTFMTTYQAASLARSFLSSIQMPGFASMSLIPRRIPSPLAWGCCRRRRRRGKAHPVRMFSPF